MEISDRDLEYYLAQVRRTAESRTKSAEKEIRKIYKDMLKDLKQFLGDAYAADADPNDRLSFTDLNQKRKYARFIEEAAEIVNGKMPAAMKETQEVVAKVYSLSHKGMIEAVKKSTTSAELKKELKGIRAATAEMIKRAAQNPLHGLTLSQTLERNRKEVVFEIQQMLNIGLMNGDRYSTMAKRITERVDIDYRKAVRIVRTETHRVREAGFNDSATDINDTLKQGVTAQRLFKTWQTMEDERVRDTNKANHRKMNGVSVGMDEEFDLGNGVKAKVPGQSGSAANDVNCRCFVVYELKEDEEAAKAMQAKAEKQNPAYALNEEKPKRPDRNDYADDEELQKARSAYREQRAVYSEKLDEAVRKNLDRKQIFETDDDIMEWAKGHGIEVEKSVLERVDKRAFNDVAFVLDEQFRKYPFLRGGMRYYGAAGKAEFKFSLRFEDTGEYIMEASGGLNLSRLFADYEGVLWDMLDQAASGFNVRGDGTARTMIRHEIGHNIQSYLIYGKERTTEDRIEMGREMSRELRRLAARNLNGMSEYATTNENELFAEGYAAYSSGQNSEFAREFGKLFERWMEDASDVQ